MSTERVVSNASPIIALHQIHRLDLLNALFSTVIVPHAVVRETSPTLDLPTWIVVRGIEQPIGPRILRASLGHGEREALSLATELNPAWVLLDDRPARRLAESLGLKVIGTLGILLATKRRGLIPAVRPSVDALVSGGFRVSSRLYRLVLTDAGEQA